VLEPMAHQARQAKIVYQLVPARRIAQCRCRDYAITRAEQETRRPSAASVNRSLSKEADRLGPPWVSYGTLQRMSTLKRTSRKSRERPARHDLAQASTLGIQLSCTGQHPKRDRNESQPAATGQLAINTAMSEHER
jgi:hypothetical protein